MRLLILTAICLSCCQAIFGQHKILYQGVVLDSKAKPVNEAVIVKLTDRVIQSHQYFPPNSIKSDKSGNYDILLEAGDWIQIWPYPKYDPNQFSVYEFRVDPFDPESGILYTLESSASIERNINFGVDSVSFASDGRPFVRKGKIGNRYTAIKFLKDVPHLYSSDKPSYSTIAIGLQFGLVATKAIERIKLQETFTQGLSSNGMLIPEPTTAFSWGSHINESGSINRFRNQIFEQGNQANAGLDLNYRSLRLGTIVYHIDWRTQQGILSPNTGNTINSYLRYENSISKNHKLEGVATFTDVNEHMPLIGTNYANFIRNAYATPFNVDGRNNTSILSDSYENPWTSIAQNRDQLANRKYAVHLTHTYNTRSFELKPSVAFQTQGFTMDYGLFSTLPSNNQFRFYERQLNSNQLDIATHTNLKLTSNPDLLLVNNILYTRQHLGITKDMFRNTTETQYPRDGQRTEVLYHRLTNQSLELQSGLNYIENKHNYPWKIKWLNSLLMTDRSHQRIAYNILTEVHKTIDTDLYDRPVIWGKFQLNHTEPNQIENDIQFSTLHQPIENFSFYLPHHELLLMEPVNRLQQKINYEVGITADAYRHQWGINFYQHFVKNAFVPYYENDHYTWINGANYKQHGVRVYGGYTTDSYRNTLGWNTRLDFHHYRNETTKLHVPGNRLPFAGFENISKNFIVGRPIGTIVGAAFEKNQEGSIIIAPSGFPMLSNDLQVIGDPNPDFVLISQNNFTFKGYSLSMSWEWSKGGQVWNGTSQTLNYYGRSLTSSMERNTTGYVFQGVNTLGQPNDIRVDFYDPDLDISENRWVRYGPFGIAEDAIEDASYLRFSKLVAGKEFVLNHKTINSIKVSLFAENLLLISPYSGNFSQSTLLGQSNAVGLDYFNNPLIRKFGATIHFNL